MNQQEPDRQRDPRRYFGRDERAAAFLAAEGICPDCGTPLEPGFHTDHDLPHSRGGITDAVNANAMCPICNRRKAARVPALPPGPKLPGSAWPLPLRDWQQEAFERFRQHTEPDFLASATPAAGKTRFGVYVAHELLRAGKIDRVAVVCPTRFVAKQWSAAFAEAGLDVEANRPNGAGMEVPGSHGIAVTYGSVAHAPAYHRFFTRQRTLLIADEPHHMGETLAWAEGARHAFEHAVCRLLITGTPFRSDNNPIPWVRYDQDGVSQADYAYGYSQALADGVCRPVFFHAYGGEMAWREDGATITADFDAALDGRGSSRRLRTSLLPEGGWMFEVLNDANARLEELRTVEPDAGGLVIAADCDHARQIARVLRGITGTDPIVILSDEDGAEAALERFRASDEPWVIAVRMISEGVDVPRLRVAVYATNVRQALFFRQAVGRVVRVRPGGGEQDAHLYIPADPELSVLAAEIEQERDHMLVEEEDPREVERDDGEIEQSDFTPLSSEAEDPRVIFHGTEVPSPELVALARNHAARHGIDESDALELVIAAASLSNAADSTTTPTTPAAGAGAGQTPQQRREQHRRAYRRKVNRLHFITGEPQADIFTRVNKSAGFRTVAEASADQLTHAIDVVAQEVAGRAA